MPSLLIPCYVLEGLLVLAGVILTWRKILSTQARARWYPVQLTAWPGGLPDLLLYLTLSLIGAGGLPSLAVLWLRRSTLDANSSLVILAMTFQTGLLLGVLSHRFFFQKPSVAPPTGPGRPFRDGLLTFLVAMPAVALTSAIWQGLLGLIGFEVRKQDVIQMFEGIHSIPLRILFIAFATVAAPIAEELIFRAGIFRFLRGRIPIGWAVSISALLFGGAHLLDSAREGLGSLLPLVVLGAIFAVAYERTGRISTTIVAHALFNLNTVIGLLAGVSS